MRKIPRFQDFFERTYTIRNQDGRTTLEISHERDVYASIEEKARIIRSICIESKSLYVGQPKIMGEEDRPKYYANTIRIELTKLGKSVFLMAKIIEPSKVGGYITNPYAKIFEQVVYGMSYFEPYRAWFKNLNGDRAAKWILDEFSAKVMDLYNSKEFKKNYNSFFRAAQKNRVSINSYIHKLLLAHHGVVHFSQIKISKKHPDRNQIKNIDLSSDDLESVRKLIIGKIKEKMHVDFLGYVWKIDLGFNDPDSIRIFVFFKNPSLFRRLRHIFASEIEACQSTHAFALLQNCFQVSGGQVRPEKRRRCMSPEAIADLLIAPDFLIRFTLGKHRLLGKGQIGSDPCSKK